MTGFILYALLLGWVLIEPGPEIDFRPKQLNREIERVSGCSNPLFDLMKPDSACPVVTGQYYAIGNSDPVKYAYIGRVFTCRAEGCCVSATSVSGEKTEFFDYFILFDQDVSVISVQIYNYEATHGQEITVRGWLKQFTGFHAGKELVVGKNVDAIAGATISVNSITDDIAEKAKELKDLL